MSRGLTAGLLAEILAGSLRPVLFFEGVFSSGTLRLWSGVSSIDWNGYSWTGAGNLMSISDVQETSEIRAAGVTVVLSGLNTALMSIALAQVRQGLAGRVWVGAMDASNAIIADPFMAFEGRLDAPDITDNGESCTIAINYESRLIDLERPRERRITHEDQQIEYPGDLGREHLAVLQNANIAW